MRDVLIIGGGPAGSTAAILLARRGWGVTLVEQHRFPRDKVCGECLSALGFEVLERLRLRDLVQSLATPLQAVAVHCRRSAPLRLPLPHPMWGISRVVLDGLLFDAARASGATIRQPARCESIESTPSPRVRLRDLTTNRVEELRPTHVIVADGKAALCDSPPPPTDDFGIKAHFTDVDGHRDTIALFATRDGYGGLAAIEPDPADPRPRWNAAFSVPAARLRERAGNVDALFDELRGENPALAQRLRRAQRLGRWLAAPLPRFAVRHHWPQHVIPVGNAAAAIEPIGGEGMGVAMRSAELAAIALDGFSAPEQLSQAYRSLWRTRGAACRSAALALTCPFAGRLVGEMGRSGVASRVALRLMGKV